jgi:hypothetical protein
MNMLLAPGSGLGVQAIYARYIVVSGKLQHTVMTLPYRNSYFIFDSC